MIVTGLKTNSLGEDPRCARGFRETIRRTLSPGLHRCVVIFANTPTPSCRVSRPPGPATFLPIAIAGNERLLGVDGGPYLYRDLSGRGMLVLSVAWRLGLGNSFACLLCCPVKPGGDRKRHPRSAKLTMLEAAFSSWRKGEGGCRQSDPGSPYLSYPFINFHNKCRGDL